MSNWAQDAIFYHIYPLGQCGAPEKNDFSSPPQPRLDKLSPWLEHARSLGCTAIYLGPLFESSTHGYDTADYFNVDRRLGGRQTLTRLNAQAHGLGLKVVLDAVFNHVGRDFWAFRDVLQNGPASPYCAWFSGLRFDQSNKRGDPFSYDTWQGYDNLVKLNLKTKAVRSHLLEAVKQWLEDYQIDGLRLDAADCVDLDFQQELAAFCRERKPDFWLMGEIVAGDYRRWANTQTLDSVTNYEAYKGLYSSFNDHNFFEIAWSFNRQFGEQGIYRGLNLYNFADNHDVSRVASMLLSPAHLIPLYTLLFTMPGLPSIYYGSEFGVRGQKNGGDAPLRPELDLDKLKINPPEPGLSEAIRLLISLRSKLRPLREGNYHPLHVSHEQLAFLREVDSEQAIALVNAAEMAVDLELKLPDMADCRWQDALRPGEGFDLRSGRMQVSLPPCSGRVLVYGKT
jgi:cyclomaltodextrinase / maltogenic alpha-amylase / neopullulanase